MRMWEKVSQISWLVIKTTPFSGLCAVLKSGSLLFAHCLNWFLTSHLTGPVGEDKLKVLQFSKGFVYRVRDTQCYSPWLYVAHPRWMKADTDLRECAWIHGAMWTRLPCCGSGRTWTLFGWVSAGFRAPAPARCPMTRPGTGPRRTPVPLPPPSCHQTSEVEQYRERPPASDGGQHSESIQGRLLTSGGHRKTLQ